MLNCNNYRGTIGNVVCEYSEEQNLYEKLDLLNSEYNEIIDSIEFTKELIQVSVSEIDYNNMFLKKINTTNLLWIVLLLNYLSKIKLLIH